MCHGLSCYCRLVFTSTVVTSSKLSNLSLFSLCFVEDVKRLNEKLTEANATKIELQLKLDEVQTSAFSVKVNKGTFVV